MKTVAMIPDEALEDQGKKLADPKFFTPPVKRDWYLKNFSKSSDWSWLFGLPIGGVILSILFASPAMAGEPGMEYAAAIILPLDTALLIFSGFSFSKITKYAKQLKRAEKAHSFEVEKWLKENYKITVSQEWLTDIQKELQYKSISPKWQYVFSDSNNNSYKIKATKDRQFYVEEHDEGWETPKLVTSQKLTEPVKAITNAISTSHLNDEDKQILSLIKEKSNALSTGGVGSETQELIEQIMGEVQKAVTLKERLSKLNADDDTLQTTLRLLNDELAEVLEHEIDVVKHEVAKQNIYVESRKSSNLTSESKLNLSVLPLKKAADS